MRDDQARIADILEAIDNIQRHGAGGREHFATDELVQVWMVHHLQIIGEASRLLSEETRARCPSVPWSSIVGMRHILVHQYFGTDMAAVWQVVEEDIPALRAALEPLVEAPGAPDTGLE